MDLEGIEPPSSGLEPEILAIERQIRYFWNLLQLEVR